MKKKLNALKSMLLALTLLVGMLAPVTSVQAENAPVDMTDRCGVEPMIVEEVSEEDISEAEMFAYGTVEISTADRAYWTKFDSDYYYTTLNDVEKAFWDALEEACLVAATTTTDYSGYMPYVAYDSSISKDRMVELMFAFKYNHAQYYFLRNSISYYTSGRTAAAFAIYPAFAEGAARQAVTAQFTGKVDQWVAQINQAGRPEDKVKIAYDIVCANTDYVFGDYDQTAYSMVCLGETVCAGYAKTMQLLLSATGVDTVAMIMSGVHAWNAVNLHGTWYLLDATWDDNGSSATYYWYLKSNATFDTDSAHGEDAFYTLNVPYDNVGAGDYVEPYFNVGGNTYFIVNDNTALGNRMAKFIGGYAPIPEKVSVYGKEYTVIVDPGTAPVIPDVSPEVRAQVEAFVERMYTVALGRDAEEDGLQYWTHMLLTQQNDGASLAQGFILTSAEFQNKNYSNDEYIKVLYKTFFNRDAASDPSGFSYWKGILNSGNSRACVLAGFVNSVEFDNLCREYGISRGYMREDGSVTNPGIWRFSERLYTKILGRSSEKEGIEYWTRMIADGAATPAAAAKEFFWSPEYVNKNTSNDQYVETLYQTFMDRASDPSGKENWLNQLSNGASREYVLECFAQSEEFRGIMASYGL